eukprot:scaffold4287_cov65-Phaeocystis_antarctica.AAC.4
MPHMCSGRAPPVITRLASFRRCSSLRALLRSASSCCALPDMMTVAMWLYPRFSAVCFEKSK